MICQLLLFALLPQCPLKLKHRLLHLIQEGLVGGEPMHHSVSDLSVHNVKEVPH